ncbi:unnamed protein product, partial [Effrenium voratum]
EMAKADYGIDIAADVGNRAIVAALITAWQTAKETVEEDVRRRAESKSMGVPRGLSQNEATAMRRALEKVIGDRLTENEEPSPDYVSTKLDEIEANDPIASALDEVQSKAETPGWDPDPLAEKGASVETPGWDPDPLAKSCLDEMTTGSKPRPVEVKAERGESGWKSGAPGPPLTVRWGGGERPLQDGLGKCSPGRWPPGLRGLRLGSRAARLASDLNALVLKFCVDKIPESAKWSFALALGRLRERPFKEADIQELRDECWKLLPDPQGAAVKTAHQPFFLHAISQLAEALEDPDWQVVATSKDSFVEGVPVGFEEPIEWVPDVYEEVEREKTYDSSERRWEMDNYDSASDAGPALQQHFEKEESMGHMFPLSGAEARRRYPGGRLRIAAQAVLPKVGGIRVIHDGTHGVQVNNGITNRNRLQSPGPGDMAAVLSWVASSDDPLCFGVAGDFSKAHRRFLHAERDWGLLACRCPTQPETVWLNRVGTFGIASAAFWWGRIAGIVGRCTLKILQQNLLFLLLFADDFLLVVSGKRRWLNLWCVIVLFEVLGAPLAWEKFRGGLEAEWVGFWASFRLFKIGIAAGRTDWVLKQVEIYERDKFLIHMRRFQEFLGRLGFTAQALVWLRPFLAPLYAWSAAISHKSTLPAPALVQLVLRYIVLELKGGERMVPVKGPEVNLGEIFRTDAKAAEDCVVLGGWWLQENIVDAAWFSLRIGVAEAPWLFKGGHSKQNSTVAELLAFYAALHAFGLFTSRDRLGVLSADLCGGTDNRACEALAAKGSSMKFPLMAVWMQVAHKAAKSGIRCWLKWRPRLENQQADRLTNEVFTDFKGENRVSLAWADLDLGLLKELLAGSEGLQEQIKGNRELHPRREKLSKRQKLESKTAWSVD